MMLPRFRHTRHASCLYICSHSVYFMTLTCVEQNCAIHSLSRDLKLPVIAQNMHRSHLFCPWEVDNSNSTKQSPGLSKQQPRQKSQARLGLGEVN